VGFLVSFFLRNQFNNRRMLGLFILALLPTGLSLLLFLAKPFLAEEGVYLSGLFPQMGFLVFLHFLMPIMAIFVGTAVIAEEVEDRTWPYLMIRPVPRWKMVAAKMIAGIIAVSLMLVASLLLTFLLMMSGQDSQTWSSRLPDFLRSCGALLLGTIVYIPLFGCLGGIIKRPVLAGLIYIFGWESTIGFFPGNVKLITIIHYLHVIFPPLQQYRFINLIIPTTRISNTEAVLVLLFIAALFTGLLMWLPSLREYRLEQSG